MKNILTTIFACAATLATAQPAPPAPEAPPTPGLWVSSTTETLVSRHDPHAKTFQNLDTPGFRKLTKYNSETGELFLQYHFLKNNEEFIYEKTVNAVDKSERERQDIIEKFEREIELPGKGVNM